MYVIYSMKNYDLFHIVSRIFYPDEIHLASIYHSEIGYRLYYFKIYVEKW